MPEIRIEWDDSAQTTILAYYPPGWTWSDYHHVLDRLVEMIGERDVPTHFINVYELGARIPNSPFSPHQKRSTRDLKVGISLYVTADTTVISMLRVSQQLLKRSEGVHYGFTRTVEEARAMLQQMLGLASG